MNQAPDKEGAIWHRDHSHGANGMGWGGLLTETDRTSIETMKQWTGRKTASTRSVTNGDERV